MRVKDSAISPIGNFWVDLVRALLWVLLPLSIVASLVLVWQGVTMNFNAYTQAAMLDGGAQTIAQGPVAALLVKQEYRRQPFSRFRIKRMRR